jgi:protein-S-isoprenylcysteine O-methyltransferase Ste14
MISLLHLLGWLACVVYSTIPAFWLLIHPRIDYWRSRSRSPYRALVPLWVVMWFLVASIAAHWRNDRLYSNELCWIPAAVMFAAGIAIYCLSGAGFNLRQLGGLPELSPSNNHQQLVTSGIRSRVRHPIYLAHLCEMLAWSIGTGLTVCYALTAFAVVSGSVMIRMEDQELEQRFGDDYRDYRDSVPAVLPRI